MARRMLSGRVVAIDLVERSLRAVEVNTTGGRVEVSALAEGAIPEAPNLSNAADVGRAIRAILDRAHIGARQAVVTVPRHQAIVKPLVLPSMSADELLMAVRLQAERELPFPLAEARIDYVPTGVAGTPAEPAGGPAMAGFLLGAVQNTIVTALRSALEKAGLTVRGIGFRPCASAAALLFAGIDTAGELVGLVDIGDELTEIDILASRRLVFSRSVTVGANPSVGAALKGGSAEAAEAAPEPPVERAAGLSLFEQWEESLVFEVRRSLEAFAHQPGGGRVARLYVAGAGAVNDRAAGALAEGLGLPVAVLDPFARTDLAGRARKEGVDRLAAFATALGAAVAEAVDLLPTLDFLVSVDERMRKAPVRRPIYAAVGLALLAAALVLAPILYFAAQNRRVQALKDRVAQLKKEKLPIAAFEQKTKELAPWTDPAQRVTWRQVYQDLEAVWPPQQRAYLTSLRCQRTGEVLLDGRVQNSRVVEELMAGFRENQRHWADPELSFIRLSDDRMGYPWIFQVKVTWRGQRGRPGSAGAPGRPRTVEGRPTTMGSAP